MFWQNNLEVWLLVGFKAGIIFVNIMYYRRHDAQINDIPHNENQHNNIQHNDSFVIVLSVTNEPLILNVVMLNVVILSLT